MRLCTPGGARKMIETDRQKRTFCLAKSALRWPRPWSSSHCPICHTPPKTTHKIRRAVVQKCAVQHETPWATLRTRESWPQSLALHCKAHAGCRIASRSHRAKHHSMIIGAGPPARSSSRALPGHRRKKWACATRAEFWAGYKRFVCRFK